MFDPKKMEQDLINKSLDKANKDFEEFLRRGRVDIRDAKAEFERFPERAQQKYIHLKKELLH